MAEKKCFQFIVKDKVQDVGLRLAIARQIPDELDVRTDNMPDNSVRVVVRGYEQDVKRFWEALQKQVLGKAENPTFSSMTNTPQIPIDTSRFFHKLQCEQMEKFVDVGLDMKSSILDMKNSVDKMSSNIGGMDSKLDTLPQNIAKEIAKLRKNGFL
ncbi:MAG: acylphosphatase [Deltaproteobacteria bacterium]|nr:acylphosphatase [Deltaproteobacteria bacterium]